MGNIQLEILKPDGHLHKTIINEDGLKHFQRLFGNNLKDFYKIDHAGKRIAPVAKPATAAPADAAAKAEEREAKAFDAMKNRAKSLRIKGYAQMDQPTLLAAIQEASKPKDATASKKK